MKALVVDDDVTSRYILKLSLTRLFGWSAAEASSAIEGLAFLESHEVDLLFLDVHMPELNGIEMLRTLRASHRFAELPVIMLTSETSAEAVQQALTLGVLDYLVKPLSADYISERVSKVLDRVGLATASKK